MKAKIFAFFMILAVLTVMAGGEAMALTQVNFQLNWKITGDHAPYYVALKKGWFQQEGLDVNIILGQGSGYTVKVLESGKAELGISDAPVPIKGIAQGAKIKIPIACFSGRTAVSPNPKTWLEKRSLCRQPTATRSCSRHLQNRSASIPPV